jgi:hypothetical protein
MPHPLRTHIAAAALLALLVPATFLRAEPPVATTPAKRQAAMADGFLRFVDNGAAGGRLETSDVTYRNADGVTVRLVAAVHIGEKSYYRALGDSFAADDAVLYELVKPRGAALPAPGQPREGGSGVGEFQRMLKDVLNLDFQLDAIDYSSKNFVHADLDAETFRKLQEERGETFEMLFIKQLMKALSNPPPGAADDGPEAQAAAPQVPEIDGEQLLRDMIRLVTLPDMERRVKLMLAKQMVSVEAGAAGFFGDPDNNVIVTERNKAAMNVLSDTIASGKKKISVFYGAAHMPDFARRLDALGFKPVNTEWRMAWDLKIREDQPSALEQLLIDGVKALSEGE